MNSDTSVAESLLSELGLSVNDLNAVPTAGPDRPKPVPPPIGEHFSTAVHRQMEYLQAKGLSRKEIAAALGYSEAQVRNVLTKPESRQRVAQMIGDEFQDSDPIMARLEAELGNTIDTLIELRDDPTKPAAVRLGAVKEILERRRGKSVAYVETTSRKAHEVDPQEEHKKLLAEIEANKAKLSGPLTSSNAIIQN